MSFKRITSSVALTLVVSLVAISFFYPEETWNQLLFLKKEFIGERWRDEPNELIAHEDHDHPDSHDHHEENIVKLTEKQIQQLGLKFEVAGPGALHMTLSAPGKIILQPDHLAHIIPKVSGTAVEASKNIGTFVKVGEVLAILESREMADMKAAFLAALSKERLAASGLTREEKLYQEKVSPLQDYLNAKNAYEEAVINRQLAQQKLSAFGMNTEEINQLAHQNDPSLRLYFIRSPIDGTVIKRHITKGEFIDTNATIYEIADLRTVWLEIGIYPKDLNRVKQGQLVEVLFPGEAQSIQVPLIYVSPIVENETITAKGIAEIDNFQGIWRPGTFVNTNIIVEKKTFPIVVAKSAIQNSDGKDFVFLVTPEGFERRFVKLGNSDRDYVEILSGLNVGDEYVANNTFLLKAELGKSTAEHHH